LTNLIQIAGNIKTEIYRYLVEAKVTDGWVSKYVDASSHEAAVLQFCKECSNTPVLSTRYVIDLRQSRCNIRVTGDNPDTTLYYEPGRRLPINTIYYFTMFFLQEPGDTELKISGEIER